jgi:hypothetical protein
MGRITAEIAPGTDHPTLDSIKQRNTGTTATTTTRRRSLLPAVTGEASTIRCRVAPAKTETPPLGGYTTPSNSVYSIDGEMEEVDTIGTAHVQHVSPAAASC